MTTPTLADTPLRRSLAIQLRVIGALLQREIITRYGRHNIGFLWLFVEPMIFTLGVTLLWTATRATHGSNLPIVPFAVTGYSSVLLWRNSVGRCARAVEPNLSLLYHRNVLVIDIFASRLLLEIAGATVSFLALALLLMALGWMSLPADPLRMLAGWALSGWFAAGLALVIGAWSERSEAVERIWHPISYFLLPASGAFFMVDWLPHAAQQAVLWIPLVHGVEMLRHGYFGESVHTFEDPGYLALVSLLLTLLGLALMRETARRVEPE